MSGLPEITVAGNVVAEPEMRHTESGVAVVNFRIAANDRRYDQNTGQWTNAGATFLRCSLWRQAAFNVAESIKVGDRVLVAGVLRQNNWETQEGEKRTSYELAVNEIGLSLKFNPAQSSKPTRTTSDGTNATEANDPFAHSRAASSDPFSDQPPF